MLLDVLLIIGTLEKAIGNSVKITFAGHGGDVFPNGLKITAEWIVERQVIKLEHVVPATELAQAKDKEGVEEWILNQFVGKAKLGYERKLHEIRDRIQQEIRNAAKAKEYQD
jgi:hypothetical protein